MKWIVSVVLNVVLLLGALSAHAELTIEITQGVDDPTAIAVVPFAWQGPGSAPEDIAAVVDGDLARSGQFAPVGPIGDDQIGDIVIPARRHFFGTGSEVSRHHVPFLLIELEHYWFPPVDS